MPLLLCALLLTPAAQEPAAPPPAPGVELPEGRAAKVWAAVGRDTAPAERARESAAALEPGAWSKAATVTLWARSLRAEAAARRATGDAPTPGAEARGRADLCLLALGQGRARDAWSHFEGLGADPALAAAVMPFLLPGVPPGTVVEAGGVPAPLPDGVVLRPALPPAPGLAPPGVLEWRTARIDGLRVGEAVLRLTISVEGTGVQVDVEHLSGGPARLAVVLPEPAGFEIRVEYVDWMRQDDLHRPLVLEVLPGEDEPHSLYGRVLERRASLPTGAAERIPRQILEGDLILELPAGDPEREWIGVLAREVAGLLGIGVRLRDAGAPAGVPPSAWSGTVLRLPAGDARRERLRYLVSAVERFVLRGE